MPKSFPADMGLPALWSYLGGTAAACGTASTAVTIPSGSNMALLYPAGGLVYWQINGASAGSTSPGYAAADTVGFIPAIDNLTTLHVGGVAATVVHVEFYQVR
jgi:hypothetical protein